MDEFKSCDLFGCDTETFGALDWHPLYFRTGKIRTIQIALPSKRVLIADLGGWEDNREARLFLYKEFLNILADKLACRKTRVVMANGKFDLTFFLYHFGFKGRQIRDVMLISQVLYGGVATLPAGGNSERALFGHSLKKICERLNIEIDKGEQTSNWGWALSNRQLNYAGKDALVLLPIFQKLQALVKADGVVFSAMAECSAIPAFVEMEVHGFPVDVALLKDYIKLHKDHLVEVLKPFTESFPGVSWTSGDEVAAALLQKYPNIRLPSGKKSEKPSTASEVLAPLNLPEANALLIARTVQTTLTYLESLLDVSFPGPKRIMAARGIFRSIAPEATGRSACSTSVSRTSGKIGAQLQNPKAGSAHPGHLPHPRDVFRAPEGYQLILYDAAASHARIATKMAKARILTQAYTEGLDNHSMLAADIAGVAVRYFYKLVSDNKLVHPQLQTLVNAMGRKPWSMAEIIEYKKSSPVATALRDIAKVLFYGSLNGAGVGRLTSELHGKGFAWVVPDVVQEMRQFFYDLHPEIPTFIKKNFAEANSRNSEFRDFYDLNGNNIFDTYGTYGYVTALTGRRKYLVKEEKDAFGKRVCQVDYGKATAAVWLMTEADAMKHWLGQGIYLFDENPIWDAHVVNMAHDEGAFIAKTQYALTASEQIYRRMEESFSRWLYPIPFDDGDVDYSKAVGQSWSELH